MVRDYTASEEGTNKAMSNYNNNVNEEDQVPATPSAKNMPNAKIYKKANNGTSGLTRIAPVSSQGLLAEERAMYLEEGSKEGDLYPADPVYDPLGKIPPSYITTKNLRQFLFLNKKNGRSMSSLDESSLDVALECYETLDKTYLSSIKNLTFPVTLVEGRGILIGRPSQNQELPRSNNGLFSAKILSRQHAEFKVHPNLKKVLAHPVSVELF